MKRIGDIANVVLEKRFSRKWGRSYFADLKEPVLKPGRKIKIFI
jgi:hypothetical protein